MVVREGIAFALITKLDRASSLRVRIARANFRERTRLRGSISRAGSPLKIAARSKDRDTSRYSSEIDSALIRAKRIAIMG